MTNAEIIHNTKLLNGIVEECHTFQEWKALGYQVKRGCKALFKASVWKPRKRKTTKDDDAEDEMYNGFFLTSASFFGKSQVEVKGV